MCRVNYVDEMNCFFRYAKINQLTGRERLLWTALFAVANNRATYNPQDKTYSWPDGFFPVTNSELFLESTLDKRGIETIRNQLKQRGLIDFKQGDRNKRPPSYKINYLSLDVRYKNAPNSVPSNVPSNAPNSVPNNAPNSVPSSAPILLDIGLDRKINININNNISGNCDYSAAGAQSAFDDFLASSGMTGQGLEIPEGIRLATGELTAKLFQAFGGRTATEYDRSLVHGQIVDYDPAAGYSINPERVKLLSYCFQQAVHGGNPGNWNYITGCMRELSRRGLNSLRQIEDYEERREA